jgi:hypothetical protein
LFRGGTAKAKTAPAVATIEQRQQTCPAAFILSLDFVVFAYSWFYTVSVETPLTFTFILITLFG